MTQIELDFAAPSSGPATSAESAGRILPDAARLRRRVYDFIRSRGAEGATDEEIQVALSMTGNTERPRRWELRRAGLVRPSGLTRKTVFGGSATVWVAGGDA
jgi:hypothetical protein